MSRQFYSKNSKFLLEYELQNILYHVAHHHTHKSVSDTVICHENTYVFSPYSFTQNTPFCSRQYTVYITIILQFCRNCTVHCTVCMISGSNCLLLNQCPYHDDDFSSIRIRWCTAQFGHMRSNGNGKNVSQI